MRILVTGGAGFVGSHLAETLSRRGNELVIVDDLSNGRAEWIPDNARFVEGDLTDQEFINDVVTADLDAVFHLASRKDVNDDDPQGQFQDNTAMTQLLIDAMLEADVPELVFTSSSTVYGEAPRPTPEDYAPLEPISVYGASKLACEGLLSTAAHTHGLNVYNLRFANVVGSRLRGAVIPDFIEKLRDNPDTLTILGNGRQQKSYLHIEDCIEAILHVWENTDGQMATYNLGTRTTTSVDRIAEIVADEMGLSPDFEYTGGDRGWEGDVPKMRLSIEKLDALGWTPSLESDAAVRAATQDLLEEM